MNRKNLHTTYNIVAFIIIGIVTLSGTALAVPITYDISYDNSSGITTLFNSPESSADLQFWTRTGTMKGMPLLLAPGDIVTINSTGSIDGSRWFYQDGRWIYKNKDVPNGGSISWEAGFEGNIYIIRKGDGSENLPVPGTPSPIIINPGDHVGIRATKLDKIRVNLDAQVTPITLDTDFYFQGPDWPGNPNQANIELLSGGLHVVDDTSTATGVFTENTGTACIPEPSILSLIALGFAGLWMGKRKLDTSLQNVPCRPAIRNFRASYSVEIFPPHLI